MKNTTILILLMLMILLSLFSGISINGNWGFVFQYEFFDFLQLRETKFFDYFLWVIIIVSDIGIFSLPFLVNKDYFKKLLFTFPLIYLGCYFVLSLGFFLLLIPFAITWIITLLKLNKVM
jgi:hypothetical protein